ncbi:MAG: hypothetical protein Q8N99_05230 [Nanoarchaeota archaeon]|nr:hypothetical protein [Nanoarchaeota archaeon]
MKKNDFIVLLSIIIIIIILINVSVILLKISSINKELTGSAAGYVNLTILRVISINLSRDVMNWSSGQIDDGKLNATLYTQGDNIGHIDRGNWSGDNAYGLIIKNLGNLNCSIYIQTEKNAHDLFNSTSYSNEEYKINVSNRLPNSCISGTLGQWINANKTSGGTLYCNQLDFHSNKNELFIDILFTVPYDSENLGLQSDNIIIYAQPPI